MGLWACGWVVGLFEWFLFWVVLFGWVGACLVVGCLFGWFCGFVCSDIFGCVCFLGWVVGLGVLSWCVSLLVVVLFGFD